MPVNYVTHFRRGLGLRSYKKNDDQYNYFEFSNEMTDNEREGLKHCIFVRDVN